ncbi:MAG TPA: hypothetical protein VN456_10475 [Desulfosporosinus sp.]|nr:hypothetical protein [Desulfosporosinus sp.]
MVLFYINWALLIDELIPTALSSKVPRLGFVSLSIYDLKKEAAGTQLIKLSACRFAVCA